MRLLAWETLQKGIERISPFKIQYFIFLKEKVGEGEEGKVGEGKEGEVRERDGGG